jgi:hypothetical protein
VTPLDALIWLWGYGPLPGQERRGSDFPEPVETLVRRLATVWMDTRTVELSAAGRDDRERYTEFLTMQRKALRELTQGLTWLSVSIPAEILDYLAEHPDHPDGTP